MNHAEFMKELCRIVGKFSETLPASETEGCFCRVNPLSSQEIERGNWKSTTDVLSALREKLGVPASDKKED